MPKIQIQRPLPLPRKAHALRNSHENVPRYTIIFIGLFNVELIDKNRR